MVKGNSWLPLLSPPPFLFMLKSTYFLHRNGCYVRHMGTRHTREIWMTWFWRAKRSAGVAEHESQHGVLTLRRRKNREKNNKIPYSLSPPPPHSFSTSFITSPISRNVFIMAIEKILKKKKWNGCTFALGCARPMTPSVFWRGVI